ncbi:nuclear transport factor 2 family protein [Paraburkholderia sp. LEh10]|uniref:nuclear transport factor 2 family protein n=1 Tax=Paraburkholderia sp. LEh10 TaxID=2821353 RepID=UPI001AE91F5A|nr:nuclear transport factor 2 family protein [Paraburkholderia sp. LEh10]MBP0590463.1 nuclear transport factor 2 family protein [Paraburkholderia sp. LEh10]
MKRADEIQPRDVPEELALGYFTLLMKRDLDGFAQLWHEDAINHIPFRPEGFGKFVTDAFVGRDQIMEHYRIAFKNRSDHVFWIDHIHRTENKDIVIVEAHANSLVGETKRVYENQYVCIFTASDGKLVSLKEYTNPLAFMRAFGGGFEEFR